MDRAPAVDIDTERPRLWRREPPRRAHRRAAGGGGAGARREPDRRDADRHAAWPRHFHHVNEELFLVLSGEATLRYSDATQALRPGDMARIAPGTGIPFLLINEGAAELRYLAFSGLAATDVFEYPDSGKIGLVTGGGGPMRGPQRRRFFARTSAEVDYWDGEPEA